MIKQLKKVGNGNALFLDKALMELVGLEEGGEVQITVNEGSIILTPAHPVPVNRERFQSALERVATERKKAFRKLAE